MKHYPLTRRKQPFIQSIDSLNKRWHLTQNKPPIFNRS